MKKTLLFFGVAAAVVFAASCKQNNNGAAEAAPAQDSTAVAGSIVYFNMDKVMQGYDIRHHVMYDMRVGSPYVAIPNPLRDHDCVMWTVAKWVRQFDRVVKYWNRGFDTRPMAKFYLDMIDGCIEAGCLFDSDESQEAFETFAKEFLEKRATIAEWYEQHKED